MKTTAIALAAVLALSGAAFAKDVHQQGAAGAPESVDPCIEEIHRPANDRLDRHFHAGERQRRSRLAAPRRRYRSVGFAEFLIVGQTVEFAKGAPCRRALSFG
jgi:hypothetical protein